MLKRLRQRVQRFSNKNNFLILLAANGIYFPIFFFADVPFGLRRILPHAHGGKILDMELFYTAEQAYQRLALFGETGRAVYRTILLGDLVYPALYGGLLCVSITLLFRRLNFTGAAWQTLGLLPLATMGFDYLEDALLLTLLGNYPLQLTSLATAAGFATLCKNLFAALSLLALGVGLLGLPWRRRSGGPG